MSYLKRLIIDEGACPYCGGDVGRGSELCLNNQCRSHRIRQRNEIIVSLVGGLILISLSLLWIYKMILLYYEKV